MGRLYFLKSYQETVIWWNIFGSLWRIYRSIGQAVRVFANGPGDQGSIPGRVIQKTLKMTLDASLLYTRIIRWGSRVKWSNPGKGVAPFPYTSVAIEKGAFGSPSTMVTYFTLLFDVSAELNFYSDKSAVRTGADHFTVVHTTNNVLWPNTMFYGQRQ